LATRSNEEALLKTLREADAARAAQAAARLWELWHRSGDPSVDAWLRQGMEAMDKEEFAAAETIFTRVIERAPHFAEGWNKRATTRFLARDYGGAIADCREVLARKPFHFGALSGQGLCHLAREEYRDAAAMFRKALAVHPHLEGAQANLRAALSELVKWN
jgi:tetratricopeptide (TPR) repeat protein